MESSIARLILLLILLLAALSSEASTKVYLVYVNGGSNGRLATRSAHTEALEQVLDEGRKASESHIYSYKESFTGFAARLTDEERERLESLEDVLAVEQSKEFKLQITRSWDFIGLPTNVNWPPGDVESDLIVGVLDTGIWPDLESFRDDGLGPPPSKWKGDCQNITCNNKIIGARAYYSGDRPLAEEVSVIDIDGHGTHVASIAAGTQVRNASFFGLGQGTARGGVPSARIAVYKICWKFSNESRCSEHDVLAAIDDAIQDGVDVVSASFGVNSTLPYYRDVLAIASFRAMKKGILTSAAAGNSGPTAFTVSNGAPWILTVAASSIDRKFVGEVELGNGLRIRGNTVNGFPTQESLYPIVFGRHFHVNKSMAYDTSKGKNVNLITPYTIPDVEEASNSGARGVIAVEDICVHISAALPLPGICLTSSDAARLTNYVNGTRHPVGKIHKSRGIYDQTAPVISWFSSRGPNAASPDILKPDISAPGVEILAAWSPKAGPSVVFPSDKRSSAFNIMSGTSMACPHASAVALYVKAFHPSWSPAAIKSGLMTTAIPINPRANPEAEFASGSGQINPQRALHPGLVYDATEGDYVRFLCAEGYSDHNIRHITGDNNATCSNIGKINTKNLNYPSMSAKVAPNKRFKVEFKRIVTNVGISNSSYRARTEAPHGLHINVIPPTLPFRLVGQKLEFSVVVSGEPLRQGSRASGSLVWTDGQHRVRSPILVYAL